LAWRIGVAVGIIGGVAGMIGVVLCVLLALDLLYGASRTFPVSLRFLLIDAACLAVAILAAIISLRRYAADRRRTIVVQEKFRAEAASFGVAAGQLSDADPAMQGSLSEPRAQGALSEPPRRRG
jgi:hypothetical protein